MRCKIYEGEKVEPWYSAEQTILAHRGIPLEDQKRWLEASPSEQYDWSDLEMDKMIKAVNIVDSVVKNNGKIVLIVD